jgi:hypothetical protein
LKIKVRVTTQKCAYPYNLTRTSLSACFIKKKVAFKRLCLEWQTKLYDLRKKYHDELAEMHLIIECMDDDLRQMIMAKKG